MSTATTCSWQLMTHGLLYIIESTQEPPHSDKSRDVLRHLANAADASNTDEVERCLVILREASPDDKALQYLVDALRRIMHATCD